ncbi:MAG: carotenoid oxygenase family protein [Acidimicrobiales bacterium]
MTATDPELRQGTHLLQPERADHHPWWPLATSMLTEHDDQVRLEGDLPAGLRGTLYRNGPGRFDRAGLRKNHLLDGDGMIQALTIADDGVRYRNRFVRTRKYVDESAANRYLYDTWASIRPDSTAGDPVNIQSQAGVAVIKRNDTLYALDDGPGIYELDPRSLATRGPASLDFPAGFPNLITAHTQFDAAARTWTLVSGGGDRQHVVTFNHQGRCISQLDVPLPRPVWIHDFLMTQTHVVFVCHPLHLDPGPFLDGAASLWDSFRWQPESGNLIVVARRDGSEPAKVYEAPTAFMWHGLNAYNHGTLIVADIVGYDDPDHAFGLDPQLRAIMAGRAGEGGCPGTVRRLVLDLHSTTATEEVVAESGHEFPYVHPERRSHRHRVGYFATTRPGEGILPAGVARIDMETGDRTAFGFGPTEFCIEPVFAPAPRSASVTGSDDEAGWLLTIVNDGANGRAYLAVFDAQHLDDGPVCRAHLDHTTPFSFHGTWTGQS